MPKKTDRRSVRSRPAKPSALAGKKTRRGVKFTSERWYASAVSSIAITTTGRGDRVSGQWISQLIADAD